MQRFGDRITVPEAPVARPVTQTEVNIWLDAASQRNSPDLPDIKKLQAWLKRRNRWKYESLKRLMRWAEKQYFKEFGIYPEDARWLLP